VIAWPSILGPRGQRLVKQRWRVDDNIVQRPDTKVGDVAALARKLLDETQDIALEANAEPPAEPAAALGTWRKCFHAATIQGSPSVGVPDLGSRRALAWATVAVPGNSELSTDYSRDQLGI
jgi:hypothetical protein